MSDKNINNPNLEKLKTIESKTNFATASILKLKQQSLSQALIEWIKAVSDISPEQLHKIITFVQQLIDLGYDPEKAIEQFKYISDLQSYDRIQLLLTQLIESNAQALGVETQVLESGEPIFYLQEIVNKVNKNIITQGELDLGEGFIVLTINRLKQYEDGFLYDESNGTIRITVEEDLDKQQYVYSIDELMSYTTITSISTPFDKINGLESINIVRNNDQHILHFEKVAIDVYKISTILVSIDTIKMTVDLNIQNTMTVTAQQLTTIINPLPRNCQIVTSGFPVSALLNELLSYHKEFQARYLENRIKAIKSTILLDFDQKYSKDITYGLYGQSALVSLSTLTESLKTVVRKLDVDYEFKSGKEVTVPIVPEQLQKYDLPVERQNRIDIFGSCGVNPELPENQNTYILGMLKTADYPRFRTYDPQGATNGTGFSLPDYRVMAQTGLLTKKRSDDTSMDVPYFIECEVLVNTQQPPVVGNYLRVGGVETNTIDVAPIMSIWNKRRINIWAMQLNIGSDNIIYSPTEIKSYNPVTSYIGAKILANVTRSYKIVIKVSDVSSGSTTPPSATIKYTRNRDAKTVTIPLQLTQVQFGQTGFNICYVGVLESETVDDEFYVGMPVVATLEETKQGVYTDYDGDWTPINAQQASYPGSVINTTEADMAHFEYSKITRQPTDKGKIPKCYSKTQLPPLNHNFTYEPLSSYTYNLPGTTWPFMDTPDSIDKKYQWHVTVPTDSRILGKSFGTIPGFSPVFNFGIGLRWKTKNNEPLTWSRDVTFLKYENVRSKATETWTLFDYDRIDDYPPFTNDIAIESKDTNSSVGNIEIQECSFNTSELILPDNTLNQDAIGQSIIALQRSVRMLESYAVYIEYYLKNLDKRVGFVEDTLKKLVDVLNELTNPPVPDPSGWTIATTILNFVGQGIGLFFPLIGMAISAIGLAVAGIGEIVNGDVLAGVIDLTFAAVLGSVGAYKFSQRLKRKYGDGDLIMLDDKHDITNLGEKLGTTVAESKVMPLVQNGDAINAKVGTALVRTNTVTNLDSNTIEFTSGTIITPAIDRAKWAELVTSKIPGMDIIYGRTSLSVKRVTKYTRGSDGKYQTTTTQSQTGLGYVNKGTKDGSYMWVGFTDDEVKSFTRCNVSSSTYANMIDSVGVSKTRSGGAGTIGIDLDVASEFLTRVGYKVNRQTRYNTYAAKKLARKWTVNQFDVVEDDTVSYQVTSNEIYTGLNDNYQSQDALTNIISAVVGT